MTRNQMLARMVEVFNTCKLMGYDDPKALDRVLEICEESGMLPPHSDEIFQKNAKVYIEPSGNEWEEENE